MTAAAEEFLFFSAPPTCGLEVKMDSMHFAEGWRMCGNPSYGEKEGQRGVVCVLCGAVRFWL